MHKKFNHEEIEKKWQDAWEQNGAYTVGDRNNNLEKEYVLVELPYPSGNLHIGHWFAFAVVDIYVRARRMQGKQVVFPMGFDAFGLPAENAAIKRNVNPKEWTRSNIEYMKNQLKSMGNAFSWDKTATTTDPEYYKWTQWMFTQFFEKGIAYRGTGVVNWCPGCNTVIANEQVLSDNTCERSGDTIEKREMPQWMLRITDYADRLVDDLDGLNWPEHIKESQRQWIGRSKGAHIPFKLSAGETLTVFTTRPDTLFGATYIVLAPEHDLIERHKDIITNWEEVSSYRTVASQKDEILRTKAEKEKTGIQVAGITATNPANGKTIPVYVADYVLKGYGTGAIMAVPAHDERDFAFAKKFNLPITQVVSPLIINEHNPPQQGLPEVKRETILVFLRDIQTKKYVVLDWHKTLAGITTVVMGGIEAGETVEEASVREIIEETGITDARLVRTLPWVSEAKYCASHKGENRHAVAYACLFEVDGIPSDTHIDEHEMENHTLRWVDAAKLRSEINVPHQRMIWDALECDGVFACPGKLINSEAFDGMDSEEAKEKITEFVGGKLAHTYRLRDWSIGRQRYWGVPIPIVYDPQGKPHPIPKEHLPWLLPEDVDFKPTGEAPLAKSTELKNRVTQIFGEGWTPEVETMDTFVDSSWYFLRYIDNANPDSFASLDKQNTWMPIDIYFGGAEHTTMHLLYSRFWQKALFDLGLVAHSEPYKKRVNRGLVLGPDGNKMSKSKGNVIDPDEQVKRLGADTVKMYLAFLGPYGELANYPWDIGGIAGLRRFLERVYGLSEHIASTEDMATTKLLHKTILKVSSDIAEYKFNTAISALMVFINQAEKTGITEETFKLFLRILAPFAPHITEELWHTQGELSSIHAEAWPTADQSLLVDDSVTITVQINGKVRGTLLIPMNSEETQVLELLKTDTHLESKLPAEFKRIIYVKNRILNIIG